MILLTLDPAFSGFQSKKKSSLPILSVITEMDSVDLLGAQQIDFHDFLILQLPDWTLRWILVGCTASRGLLCVENLRLEQML